MTLDQFITTNTNVGIDTDGAFGYQCMDLMHAYCRDVLGLSDLSILAQPNAKSVWLNFTNVKGHELFEKIANTPTGVPLKGDIVLYDWGTDGHVDIFVQGDVNSFRSFSQNFPTGSKSIVVNHPNYNGVYGWLRLKPTTTIQVDKAVFEKLVANSTKYDAFVAAGYPDPKAVTDKIALLNTQLDGANKQTVDLKLKLNQAKAKAGEIVNL